MPNCCWRLCIDLFLKQRFQEPQGFISIMELSPSPKEDLATSWEGADGSEPRFCHVIAGRDIINTSHGPADILSFAGETQHPLEKRFMDKRASVCLGCERIWSNAEWIL